MLGLFAGCGRLRVCLLRDI